MPNLPSQPEQNDMYYETAAEYGADQDPVTLRLILLAHLMALVGKGE